MVALRPQTALLLIAVLALALVALGVEPTAASAPTLHLVAPAGPHSTLVPVDIQLHIAQAANLGAWEFDLQYDPALVTIAGITLGAFFAPVDRCEPSMGRCAISLGPIDDGQIFSAGAVSHGQGVGASGDGVIATLHVQPTGAPGLATLHFADALLTDVAANPISPATADTVLEFVAPALDGSNTVFLPVVSR